MNLKQTISKENLHLLDNNENNYLKSFKENLIIFQLLFQL